MEYLLIESKKASNNKGRKTRRNENTWHQLFEIFNTTKLLITFPLVLM